MRRKKIKFRFCKFLSIHEFLDLNFETDQQVMKCDYAIFAMRCRCRRFAVVDMASVLHYYNFFLTLFG